MPLSTAATSGVYATSSDIVALVLLTFKLEGFDDLRVVNNTVDIESRGQTYEAFPFKVKLLQEDTERLPEVTLQIDNIDGRIMQYIRSLPKAPTLTLEVVTSADNFQSPERSVDFLKLTQVGYNALAITGTLVLDNFMAARYPAHDYTPAEFPALFGVILGERRTVFAPTDPYFNFVNSILLFEGAEGATQFVDSAPGAGHNPWIRYNAGNSGDATIVSGDAKDGTKALRMVNPNTPNGIYRKNESTNGLPDYAKIKSGEPLTVEGWFKPTGFDSQGNLGLFGFYAPDYMSPKHYAFYLEKLTPTTAQVVLTFTRGEHVAFELAKITLNIWTHIAIVSNGVGRFSVFLNGKLKQSRYLGNWFNYREVYNIDPNAFVRIGTNTGYAGDIRGDGYQGLIDCVRVTQVARYWDDFTPQTAYQTVQGELEIHEVMRDMNSPTTWYCGILSDRYAEPQELHLEGDDLVIPGMDAQQELFREGSHFKDGYLLVKTTAIAETQVIVRAQGNKAGIALKFERAQTQRCMLQDLGAGNKEIAPAHVLGREWYDSKAQHTILIVVKGTEYSVTIDGVKIYDAIDIPMAPRAGHVQFTFLGGNYEHRIQEYRMSTDPDAAPAK